MRADQGALAGDGAHTMAQLALWLIRRPHLTSPKYNLNPNHNRGADVPGWGQMAGLVVSSKRHRQTTINSCYTVTFLLRKFSWC